jgi:hypothetical protein
MGGGLVRGRRLISHDAHSKRLRTCEHVYVAPVHLELADPSSLAAGRVRFMIADSFGHIAPQTVHDHEVARAG